MSHPIDKLLLQTAYEHERQRPEDVFLTQPTPDGIVDYTWSEVMDQARRMAAHLRAMDLPDNSNIAMVSKNCAHFIIAELAIWMAGHCTVALYPTLNAETVGYILDHSESKLLFVGKLDEWEHMRPGVPEALPKVAFPLAPPNDYPKWDEVIASQEPISDSPEWPGERRALICYTSGSTGRPKGVMHSFYSISAPAELVGQVFGISSEDRMLSYLPLAHVFERAVVAAGGIYHAVHVYFADSLDSFLQDMQRAKPTMFLSVPRLWLKFQSGVLDKMPQQKLNLLLSIPILNKVIKRKILTGLALENVHFAMSGSAPLPADLIRWYDKLGLYIMEGYGMSEDFAYSHVSKHGSREPGYVGPPLPGVESRISATGEIEIKSPGMMMGYFKQPELTAEVMTEDGFFKTGDRGEYSAQGLLQITGRVKELFKTSKGKYVAPAPIENLLNAHAGIELSCIAGAGRPACHAVVQLSEEGHKHYDDKHFRKKTEEHLEDLLKKVNRQIEEFEKVQFLTVVREPWSTENNFLTPTLKIKRDVIEKAYEPMLDEWYGSGKKVIWQD